MRIALIGNPNSGKTSVFNYLTGLNQQIGNYPGVTVDKKIGTYRDANQESHEVLDLPGTYSIYPKTRDEEVVFDVLSDTNSDTYPELFLVVVDASNLERNLLLFSQLYDLGSPLILILNMSDVAAKKGLSIDAAKLSELFGGIQVIAASARSASSLKVIDQAIANYQEALQKKEEVIFQPFVAGEFEGGLSLQGESGQQEQAELRYKKLRQALSFVVKHAPVSDDVMQKQRVADKLLTHPVFGYLTFLVILLIIFQAIYAWSEWPMDLIDNVFLAASQWIKSTLPPGIFTNLLAEGVVPGLGGVVIFIPQITLLFAFIFVLEESGYMSRVVFIMDRLMRPFGLNGRSVVPLISSVACAIPAIMSTRTIENWKERLITIMVTPLMSCSARLPVYTLLIAVVVPDISYGFFNLKGLVLFGLYLLGLIAALLVALVMKLLIKSKQSSFLIMEMPTFKMPRWNNLLITIIEKVRLFVFDAGKVIFAISIILWVLASYGPGDRVERAVALIEVPQTGNLEVVKLYEKEVSSVMLENSYIGILGKGIEPAISPLGYNWQIGIALITSFAAREVFVGSMATIYSVGEDFEENTSLMERMRSETKSDGSKVYTLASGLSLMIFYAFAMQCMSTLAVVLRETKKWKWPLIQLAYMTAMAYLSALLTYQILS
ncbi:MAG: ferrous iron transport protein B [Cyclobacteriaceae bacterium]|jgi:ferrous iron transport protein B